MHKVIKMLNFLQSIICQKTDVQNVLYQKPVIIIHQTLENENTTEKWICLVILLNFAMIDDREEKSRPIAENKFWGKISG